MSKGYPLVPVASTGDVQGGRQRSPHMTKGKLAPYLRVANVFDGHIDFADVNEMAFKPQEIDRFRLLRGDILLNEGQSVEPVGRCAMFLNGPKDCCYQNTLVRYRAGPETDPRFALQLFRYCQLTGIFSKIAVKTNSIAHLGVSRFADLELPFPPYQVQVKIAEILERWDTAIQKTEQLIAAKERHFAATSHLLLTSRKRLNGFSMKWELRRADEIFENTSRKRHLNEPLLSVTQERGVIPRDMLEGRVTMPSGEKDAFKLVEPGNFVISLRSFQGGLEHSNYRGLVSPAYTVLREVVEIDARFFRHYFKSADFIKRLSVAVIGIRDGKQISFQDFCSIKLLFPPVDEQKAIAAVLDEAEGEITLLRNYTQALKTQKRGLMQKLLTGQWRLSSPEAIDEETVEC
jgi:type I restriction enzyme, S subunit